MLILKDSFMLKKIAFVSVVWASFVGINASAEMLIKQDLSVSVEVEATKYTSSIMIRGSEALRKLKDLSLDNKNAIIKTYNNINESLGKESICKGGSFKIEPIYEYRNGKRIQNGFESHYNLNCEFNEEQKGDYDKILRKIESEVRKNQYLLFTFPSVQKVLDEKMLAKIDEQLNVKLLEIALQKAKEYSSLARQKCSIKEINLGALAQQERAMPTLMKASLNATRDMAVEGELENVSLPTARNTQKTAQGKVIFSCR